MKNLITSAFLLLALLLPGSTAAVDFMVDGIYYNINGNEATVTFAFNDYDYPSLYYTGDVIIPDTVTFDGITYPVTAIGEWAFSYSENMTSVSIPNTVTSIDRQAFFDCSSLSTVTIPSSVTTIDEEAFCNCHSLTNMTIPSSVMSIGDGAFGFCENLKSLTVESGNNKYDSRDDCNAIIETASNTLIAGCQNTVIPNSVTAIGISGFSGCSGLTSFNIPNSVTAIGEDAFACCHGLNSVDVPNSVTTIGEYAFRNCENLTSVTIGNAVTTIGEGAFDGCVSLASLNLGNSVTSIGDVAFLSCHSLTSLFIPKSVTSIGKAAFNGCNGLTTIVVESGNTAYDSRDNCNALIETTSNTLMQGCDNTIIPNSITAIGDEAFCECEGLKSVTIPGCVTTIGQAAFMNCHALMDVYCYITDPSSLSVNTFTFFYDNGDAHDGNYSGRTLHVPYGTVNAYQLNEHWFPYFEQIVEMNPEMELIGDVNFDGQIDIADINAIMDIIITWYAPEADVNRDGEVTIADINAIIDIIMCSNEEPEPEHEWVDLGLPSGTLWATCNIGANSPEERGDYFAWGETEPKDYYDWNTYKWCNGSEYTLTKYCNKSSYGTVDNKTELDPEDDAAYVNWGPSWRMPTSEQRQELSQSCSWQWTTVNDVNGYLVTGCNGNSIFLPAAGYSHSSVDNIGYYWLRSLNSFGPGSAYFMYFYRGDWDTWISTDRYYGMPVRAVRELPAQDLDFNVEPHNLNLGLVTIGNTSTGRLTIVNKTLDDITLSATADAPFTFQQEEGSVSSMSVVVPGNSRTTVPVMFTATTPGQFSGNVTIQNPSSDGGQCVISVYALALTNDFLGQDYVDLGLPSGTQWATCNIGASSPEDCGDYFAWGETAPKEAYTWANYKWCNGSDDSLTKYCTHSDYGTVDYQTELEPGDDAAFVNCGPSWRIPTKDQFSELMNKCNWQWNQVNGVHGYVLTGPNGNKLFLPAAGHRSGNSFSLADSDGYYLSRELYSSDDPTLARALYFKSGHKGWTGSSRADGYAVRAVKELIDDVYIEQQSLDLIGVPIGETCTGSLTIINNTMEAVTMTAIADAPFSFKQEDGSALSSMTIEVPGDSCAVVTVMFTATSPGQFNGNVTFQNAALDGGQSVIPVQALAFTDDFLHQEYVDLGLPSGTLWATCNIGANSPEERGDYFAWGETEPKSVYTWETYKWCNGSHESLTKYCTKSYYGTVDNLTELEVTDDAAYVNWGPEWRMPSLEQFKELMNHCTCPKAQINGVTGRLIIGPNGNTMFMPSGTSYWSRTLYLSPDYAYGMSLERSDWKWNIFWGPRSGGNRIRAVRMSQD